MAASSVDASAPTADPSIVIFKMVMSSPEATLYNLSRNRSSMLIPDRPFSAAAACETPDTLTNRVTIRLRARLASLMRAAAASRSAFTVISFASVSRLTLVSNAATSRSSRAVASTFRSWILNCASSRRAASRSSFRVARASSAEVLRSSVRKRRILSSASSMLALISTERSSTNRRFFSSTSLSFRSASPSSTSMTTFWSLLLS